MSGSYCNKLQNPHVQIKNRESKELYFFSILIVDRSSTGKITMFFFIFHSILSVFSIDVWEITMKNVKVIFNSKAKLNNKLFKTGDVPNRVLLECFFCFLTQSTRTTE